MYNSKNNCFTCRYREMGFLSGLSEQARKDFSDNLLRYPITGRGKYIFHQGEPSSAVYFVCSGTVKLTTVVPTGEETIVDLFVPCSVVGGIKNEERASHPCAAVTVDQHTEVARMDRRQLQLLGERHPSLAMQLARQFSDRLLELYNRVGITRLPVERRVVLLLRHLVKIMKYSARGEQTISIPLSNKELAQLVQTTPETLSRSLRYLRTEGILRTEKRRIYACPTAIEKYLEKINGEF